MLDKQKRGCEADNCGRSSNVSRAKVSAAINGQIHVSRVLSAFSPADKLLRSVSVSTETQLYFIARVTQGPMVTPSLEIAFQKSE